MGEVSLKTAQIRQLFQQICLLSDNLFTISLLITYLIMIWELSEESW